MPWFRCTVILLVGLVANDVIANPESTPHTSEFRQFDLDVFKNLRLGQTDQNLVFSPASVRTVLAMLHDGARGATRQHLDSALGHNWRPSSLLIPRSQNEGLLIANAIFLSSRLIASNKFRTSMTSRFEAWFEYSDFSRPRSAAEKINEWVQRATYGRIQELVSRDTLSAETILLIGNAVHFHGKWKDPFPKGNTKLATFYEGFQASNLSATQVPTMSQFNYFRAGIVRDLNAKVLELPFQEPSGFSMIILLPNQLDGLRTMLDSLKPNSLSQILNALDEPNFVSVTLPRFSAVTAQRLNPILPRGVSQIFSSEADFSGITENGERIHVSDALHKAIISVDEEGATASAVSAVTAILLHSVSPFEFHADHPFAYMIINKRDPGYVEPMFMGYVTNIHETTEQEHSSIPLDAESHPNAEHSQTEQTTRRATNVNSNRVHFANNSNQNQRQYQRQRADRPSQQQ